MDTFYRMCRREPRRARRSGSPASRDRRGLPWRHARHGPDPVSVPASFEALRFLPDRTPETNEPGNGAFARLREYRDGAIFVGHWAGRSEWERHRMGDEIVHVLEGETTIFFLVDGEERSATLAAGELVVVPEGTWHRFETPAGVKVMSVTPQPTDHRTDRPEDA
jgi:uncharacterized cupin superfamily protein